MKDTQPFQGWSDFHSVN